MQSADILVTLYPNDFSASDLEDHIDDLIFRFRNIALGDTIFRVGQDLMRKLSADDRFMGAIHLAMQTGKPYDKILSAMSFGFIFRAKDETGSCFPADKEFLNSLTADFESTLYRLLGFDPAKDGNVIKALRELKK